jgi:general secretion pathway protein N
LRGIADWANFSAGAVLICALFGFCAQAQDAPERDVRAVAPGEALGQIQPTSTSKKKSSLAGNPLWEVALSALQETRARPIFSPSRRPPAPPVVAVPSPPPPKPPLAREPDRLKLALLGTVLGESDAIGVFLDETSKAVIRIRIGESHEGWTLRSIQKRAANFEKDYQEAILMLPTPGTEQPASSVGGVASRIGGAGVCGNDRGVRGLSDNCARPGVPIVPVSAATTGTAHKVRQDILSIPVSN